MTARDLDTSNGGLPVWEEPVPSLGVKVALAGVVLLGFVLRLHGAATHSLSPDEINMIWMATGLRDPVLSFGNAQLYLPLLRLVSHISSTDLAFRMPAILAGTATLPLVFLVGRRLFGATTGLIAALLLAVSPFHVAVSQWAHSYSLFGLISLWAFHLAWKVGAQGDGAALLQLALVGGIGIYVHLYVAFVLAGCLLLVGLLALLRRRGRLAPAPSSGSPRLRASSIWVILLAAVLLAVLVSPWVAKWYFPVLTRFFPEGISGAGAVTKGGHRVPWAPGVGDFARLLVRLFVWRSPCVPLGLALAAFTGLGSLALARAARRYRPALAALALWVLLPLGPVAYISLAAGIDFGTRRFVFILPQTLLLLAAAVGVTAAGLQRLARRLEIRLPEVLPQLGLGLGLAVLLAASALASYYQRPGSSDYKTAARLLEAEAQPGDVILVWKAEYFDYYYRGQIPVWDIRRIGLAKIEALGRGRRIWYVRPAAIRRLPRFQKVEEWLAEAPSLKLRLSREFSVSFQNRTVGPSRELLAQQTHILERATTLLPKAFFLHRSLAKLYAVQGRDAEARRERELMERYVNPCLPF